VETGLKVPLPTSPTSRGEEGVTVAFESKKLAQDRTAFDV